MSSRKLFVLLISLIILVNIFSNSVTIGYAEDTTNKEVVQAEKTDDVTILQGKSDMQSMGLAPNEVVIADGKKGSELFDFEAFIKPSDIVDGTAPFDSNDEAGNDSSPNNGIVRTFDTITYPLKVTINPKKHDQLKNIKMKITGTLENGITNKRVNAKFAVGGKEDLEKGIVSFDMEYMLKETGNSLMIPVTVEVQGAEHELKLKPNIKIQVMSVDEKDITNENISQSFDDISPVTTSGKVNVKTRFTASYGGLPRLDYKVYDSNAKKDDRSIMYPVALDLFINNLPNRKDLRGATFPSGKINYHFNFSGKVDWDEKALGQEPLDFEGRDTPIKIFNYQAIDKIVDKVSQENTESFEIGMKGYKDPRTEVANSPKSYIPKDKWNTSDIDKYTIDSVWDSGVMYLNKPEITKDRIGYAGSVKDYIIGTTFPTMMSRPNYPVIPTFGKDEKAFSSTRFLIHSPNEYYSFGKNNKSNLHNNVYYYLEFVIDSYEDGKGNTVPYNTVGRYTITERNNPKGSYSLQTTFHTPEGKELGTPNVGYGAVSKGDPTVIVGQKVKIISHLNVRAVTEGGTTMVYKWNTDSFYLTKNGAEIAKKDLLNQGYPNTTGGRDKDVNKQQIYFGVSKNNDNSFESLTQNRDEDYDWYSKYDEAKTYGEVGAIKNDINALMGDGEVVAYNIPLDVKTKKIGSVNEKGTPNITVTDSVVYPAADRKVGYRVRSEGKYNNFTEYDEKGNVTKLQSPVGSTVNFETLGIMNGETSSEVKTNKNTYYSSDNVSITIDNLVKLPEAMDFTSLDEKVEMRVKIPKGLDYVVGSAKYGEKYVEPKIEQQSDGSNHLIWYDTLTRNNKALKKINFETRINPVLLPQGNQIGLEIQNVLSSTMDTRLEKFRTSSKNISVVKIGMVGVSETI
ncbi:fusion protein (includes pXO2-28-29-30), partial [Bacillus wiedmannii]